MTKRQRILIIGLVWPELRSSAASQNILSYASLLKDAGHYICFASAADKTPQSTQLDNVVDEEQSILLNSSTFDDFVSSFSPTIVIFDRYLCEEQFGWRVSQSAPSCVKILDCEDLHFLRDARHKAYKNNVNPANENAITEYLYSDMCKREIASILRCDLSILLSDIEIRLLVERFGVPASLLHHCRFLLPQLEQRITNNATTNTYAQRDGFISIGNFRHAPNWDAVLTIKTKLWPRIRKALPNAQCHIYGAYLPPKAKQLENRKEGFLVHGFAKDAFSVLSSAKVLLAPINFGAGIKGKLIDAMMCSTPSITSPIGAEGLSIDEGNTEWPGSIMPLFENEDAFADQAVRLYADEEYWLRSSEYSHLYLTSIFSYPKQRASLIKRIEALTNMLGEHRRQHFIGQVLQHHTLASTKYMSQWIEAKNKRPTDS
ncbi:glycosyltransferase [Glaciecola sp. MH2013]|uniref:glycosyltransferase n=1 Tax=Glaciecola sp. MH2013 TaxID=2785524 RepID=UPI001E310BB5|nr:glycosyltransferase [Glaciecola sp. MH2013]